MDIHNAYAIKDAAHNLPKTEKWANMAPGIVMNLNLAKYGQNPELMKKQLETAPHRLIEASLDSKWGGGLAHLGQIYMNKAWFQVQIFVEYS